MSENRETNRRPDTLSKTEPLSASPQEPSVLSSPSTAIAKTLSEKDKKPTVITPTGPAASSHEVDVVAGLIAILTGIREDVRAFRVGFLSNLVLAFTIPLSVLAAQRTEVFKSEWLWLIPQPRWWIFGLWVVGVVSMAVGLLMAVPGPRTALEELANYRAKQAAGYLTANRVDDAAEQLNLAILKEYDRLTTTQRSRIPFLLTLVPFLLCAGIEFALILFK